MVFQIFYSYSKRWVQTIDSRLWTFHASRRKSFTVVLIHFDDMVITSNDPVAMATLKRFLHVQFWIKDLGKLNYLIGNRGGTFQINLSRNGSIHWTFLMILVFLSCRSCYEHGTNLKRSSSHGELIKDPSQYRRLVGWLVYLMITRLDIAYPVYDFKKTLGHGLLVLSKNDLSITWYCDAIMGMLFFFKVCFRLLRLSWNFSHLMEDETYCFSLFSGSRI